MQFKKQKSIWSIVIVAALVCCVVLSGVTYALFHDNQVNTGNRIKFGTLDVDLLVDAQENGNYVSVSDGTTKLFPGNGLWEPGMTRIVYLQVQNKADLTMRYSLELTVGDVINKDKEKETEPIEEAFEYAVIRDVTAADSYSFGSWERIKRLENAVFGDVYPGYTEADVISGLLPDSSHYIALAIHMRNDARVNVLNSSLNFDVNLLATQSVGEADSQDTIYDRYATFEGQTNLLINGDFEELSGTSVVGWSFANVAPPEDEDDPPQYNRISIAEEMGVHGLNSLNILHGNSDTKYPRAGQKLQNYLPGTDVTLVGYVKDYSATDKAYPAVKVEFFTPDGTESALFEYKDLPAGEWTYFEETVRIPEGTTKCNIAYRLLGGKGMISFDDLAIYGKKLLDQNTLYAEDFEAMIAQDNENRIEVPEVEAPLDWEVTGGNQILNGDFETNLDTTDTLEEWHLASKFSPCSLQTNLSYNGSDCISLKIDSGSGGNPYFSQIVYDVIPKVQYEVTYRYKIVYGANKPTIKIESYTDLRDEGAKGGYLTPHNITPMVVQNDGQWHKVTQIVTFDEGTKDISVLARMLGTGDGEILMDDLSLTMVSGPIPMSIDTEDVFFYTEARDRGEDADFITNIKTEYYPMYATSKVKYSVYREQEKIWSETVTAVDGVAAAKFPLSLITEKAVPYAVIIELCNANDEVVYVRDRNIFVYDRPTYLHENGVFQAEGQDPFYPVIGYHVRGADDALISAEAGINLHQIGAYSTADEAVKKLDHLQSIGAKGLLAMYPTMLPSGSPANLERTIRVMSDPRVYNHPALFAYCIMDEPFLNQSDPIPDLERSYRIIRQFDTTHPIVMVENMENHFHESYNYVDCIITDAYCQAQALKVYNEIISMKKYSKNKPVYTLVQAYQSNSSWPTADDCRNNLYQALIAGAKSLGFYSVSDATKDSYGHDLALWQAPDGGKLWKGIKSYLETELPIVAKHFLEEESPMFNKALEEKYWYYSWAADGDIYMIVLGVVRNRNNMVSIPLTSQDGSISIGEFTGEVIAGKEFEVSGNGTLEMEVRSVGATLIKITPKEPVDFSGLEKAE